MLQCLHRMIGACADPPCSQAARKSYLTSVALLVELASLQTAFLTLDEAIKTTNRRVNALDSVVKPMLENTIAYIKVRSEPHDTAFVITYACGKQPLCFHPSQTA